MQFLMHFKHRETPFLEAPFVFASDAIVQDRSDSHVPGYGRSGMCAWVSSLWWEVGCAVMEGVKPRVCVGREQLSASHTVMSFRMCHIGL